MAMSLGSSCLCETMARCHIWHSSNSSSTASKKEKVTASLAAELLKQIELRLSIMCRVPDSTGTAIAAREKGHKRFVCVTRVLKSDF